MLPVEPTAQALPADVAATPDRLLPAGAGLGTCFHALPFQAMISVLGLLVEQPLQPTAQALLAEAAATPDRRLPAGAGLGTRFHAEPFQRRISALLPVEPTAQALLAEVAATPDRPPLTVTDAATPWDGARATAACTPGATPATTPASSTGTVTTLTERVASWGVRTGCHLPP